MKKLLGIVVLGLFWSNVCFAEKITNICEVISSKHESSSITLDKDNQIVFDRLVYTDEEVAKNEFVKKEYIYEYRISYIDDKKVTYYLNNLEWWKDNYYRADHTEVRYRVWNYNNPKRLKKLIKKYGPADYKIIESTWYYTEDRSNIEVKLNHYKKPHTKNQRDCYSLNYVKKKNQDKIINEQDRIKQEIEPFKLMCRNIGYSDGTEKFADCVKDLYLKKLDAENQSQTTTTTSQSKRRIDPSVWDDLLGLSKGLLEGKSGSSSSSSSLSCFKTSERVSGTNKICSYNCMGSEVTRNIRSTQICPLSIKR